MFIIWTSKYRLVKKFAIRMLYSILKRKFLDDFTFMFYVNLECFMQTYNKC